MMEKVLPVFASLLFCAGLCVACYGFGQSAGRNAAFKRAEEMDRERVRFERETDRDMRIIELERKVSAILNRLGPVGDDDE